jgi:hypothetical protein
MNKKSYVPYVCLFYTFIAAVFIVFVSNAHAYERYNDGCQNCHGAFFDGTSPKGTIFENQGNKLEMHRTPYDMETDCHMCHKNGDKNNPYIGKSAGHPSVPGLGCTGCHGREEDAGHDSISDGLGAGLRQHHWNADRIIDTESGSLSSQICADCHSDSDPANYSPVGEHVIPPYYGTPFTHADNPCNEVPQSNINENWDDFNLEGLDNDGDGLYDMNDPDCSPDTLTVSNNDLLASSVNAGDSDVQMQRLRLDCNREGDERCVITAVTVHDTEVSSTGVIDSVKIYIDDDQNFQNGTLDAVRVNNWNGEPTVVDLTLSISQSHRTVGEQGNRYILIIYNMNVQSDGHDIQSEVTVIDVAYPDNGVSGSWSSNKITTGGLPCQDNDNDGYSPDGGSCGFVDCNDNDNSVHPAAQEVCDNLDNDCDGSIDENLTQPTTCGQGECGSAGVETCTAGVWGGDTCTPGTPGTEGPDGDPTCADTIDNDCDGTADAGDSDCTSGGGENKILYTVPSSGVNIANGIQTDHGSCWNDPSSSYIEELSTDLNDICTSSYRYRQYSTGLHSEHYFNMAYTSNTIISGVSYEFTVHDGGTFGVQLFYVTSDGSRTYLGTEVTQSNPNNLDNNYTVDLSGQSGTAPSGAKLGLRTRLVSLSDSYSTVYLGNPDGRTGNISGRLIVNETPAGAPACPDGDSDGYAVCDGVCDPGGLLCGDCNDGDQLINPSETEVCDGLDNNCDGSTDEAFSNLGTSCTDGVGACEAAGSYICADDGLGTECDATPGAPGAEGPSGNPTCADTIDNDCDGTTDAGDSDCTPSCVPTGLPDNNCDGIDDDCDGTPDDGYVPTSTTCGIGECSSTGQTTCVGGVEGDTCTPGTPSTEVCDGLDNNCDNSIDEDFANLGTACAVGAGACEATGNYVCAADGSGTECSASPGTPAAEGPQGDPTCTDTIDNDCDGFSDLADLDCQSCTDADNDGYYIGSGECGTPDCNDNDPTINPGAEEICGDNKDNDCDNKKDDKDPDGCVTCSPTGKAETVCNGIDDDCDGLTDEDFTPTATSCGIGECASTGQTTCSGGVEGDTCDPLAGASPEVCDDAGILDEDCDGLANDNDPECVCVPTGMPDNNCDGIDDDCDGQIDEDYVVDDTCGAGICQTNNTPSSCTGGVETLCQPGTPTETPEATCTDGLDNDCDGKTDGLDDECGGTYIPPPVRQEIGIPDNAYNNFVEADCRFCHENPDQFPVDDQTIPNRHHLLVDMQVLSGTCSQTATTQCQHDAECPVGEFCINGTDAPFPPPPGGIYECLTCHEAICGAECTFIVERDCMVCHIQNPLSEYTVHHRTDLAQGVLLQGPDCQFCHGSIVDNRDDGHFIPSFDPTPETPARSGGTGLPLNSRGKGAGACDYCHDDGTSPEAILVETNEITHHNRGFGFDDTKCDWCHRVVPPSNIVDPYDIRTCENCHGPDSLHNIQADSDGDDVIKPGIELPWFGHIGNPDDCWGCHGYGTATAPETGPIVPTISSMSTSVLTEGTDTTVDIIGTAFTNMDQGTELLSDVELTAEDGTSTSLIPDAISEGSITVTIPGILSAGNYRVKAVKQGKFSNPKVITIEPAVTISDVSCRKKQGIITITGSGFGQKPVGSDAHINVKVNGQISDPLSWSNAEIRVSVPDCNGQQTVTVNALFGSATWQ